MKIQSVGNCCLARGFVLLLADGGGGGERKRTFSVIFVDENPSHRQFHKNRPTSSLAQFTSAIIRERLLRLLGGFMSLPDGFLVSSVERCVLLI